MSTPTTFQHVKAIIVLPLLVTVIIPFGLICFKKNIFLQGESVLYQPWFTILGIVVIFLGLILFMHTLYLFISFGKGTLAPWNPTQSFVVQGIYRHVRNPMLLAISIILFGEALVFFSDSILIFLIIFVVGNTIYFIKSEEPRLLKKYGRAYADYYQNVNRWIPKIKAYNLFINRL